MTKTEQPDQYVPAPDKGPFTEYRNPSLVTVELIKVKLRKVEGTPYARIEPQAYDPDVHEKVRETNTKRKFVEEATPDAMVAMTRADLLTRPLDELRGAPEFGEREIPDAMTKQELVEEIIRIRMRGGPDAPAIGESPDEDPLEFDDDNTD